MSESAKKVKDNDQDCGCASFSPEIGNLPIMPRQKRTPSYCLSEAVDCCFRHYYESLKGMSPAPDLYSLVLKEFERPLIERTLKFVGGNQLRASDILGINRNTLRKKIKELGINIESLMKDNNKH
ncbi:MAG: hypothetical protein GY793_04810 [Proteobacteria bacterium]|nr:hypothetical protein [Pseudomonadota bacterium]